MNDFRWPRPLLKSFVFIFISIIILSNKVLGHRYPAETQTIPGIDKELKAKEKVQDGWSQALKVGSNISLGSSENWVGQASGSSTTLGLSLDGNLNYRTKQHEWRMTLRILEASTKNPSLPRPVKSSDEITIESIYLRSLKEYKWLGAYTQLKARASLFKGEDVRSKNYTYQVINPSGTVVGEKTTNTFRLTDGLRPLNLKASIGFFAEPYEMKKVTVELRTGVGAIQVIADRQFNIDTINMEDKIIKVTPLENYSQMGLEFGLNISGQIGDKSSYELGYETLIPFFTEYSDSNKKLKERDVFELANHDTFAKLSTKLHESISFSCEYRLRKQPFLIDKTQIQSLTLVNFTYTLF